MSEVREGYAVVPEIALHKVKRLRGKEFLYEIGLDDGWCTLCYARKPERHCNPCIVGDENVIMPEHIAAIIKMQVTNGE